MAEAQDPGSQATADRSSPSVATRALTRVPRLPAVDIARGVALVAMFVYHFAFDLRFFGFVDWDVVGNPGWRGFAVSIASSFLFVFGASLVLANRERIRWRSFGRRLVVIVGAAALVTGATLVAMPDAPVLFGILHAIALFSVVGLAFLRAPIWLVLATAAAVLLLPFLWRSSVFDGIGFVWLGLAETVPPMVDHEPLFPWFTATLLGIATARIVLARGVPDRATTPPRSRIPRTLALMGRNSLLVYLIHQPIFFAILIPIAWLAPPGPGDDPMLASFRTECIASCSASNPDASFCSAVCGCIADEIRENGLEDAVRRGGAAPVPAVDREIPELTRGCVVLFGGEPPDRSSSDDAGPVPDGRQNAPAAPIR